MRIISPLFRRKKKVTVDELAQELFNAYASRMNIEFDFVHKHDRIKWQKKHQWDYDIKKHTDEHAYVYAFMIWHVIPLEFPECKLEFISSFLNLIRANDMGFVIDRLNQYKRKWKEAEEYSENSNPTSPLSNPIYAIAKEACKIRFGYPDPILTQNVTTMFSFLSEFHIALLKMKKYFSVN